MRHSALLGLILAMGASLGIGSLATDHVMVRSVKELDTARPKRRKTGKTYPHSSTRQRARYARQIAAGQIG